jgi:hypothetical protein
MTTTYVWNVHEHRKHEIEICPWIKKRLSYLVPLPRVVSDTLGVSADSIDSDSLLSIIEPSYFQLRVRKGVGIEESGKKGK